MDGTGSETYGDADRTTNATLPLLAALALGGLLAVAGGAAAEAGLSAEDLDPAVEDDLAEQLADAAPGERVEALFLMEDELTASHLQRADALGLELAPPLKSVPVFAAAGPAEAIDTFVEEQPVASASWNAPAQLNTKTEHSVTRAQSVTEGNPGGAGPFSVDGDVVDGSDVGIAVVDSGIDTTHPDLPADSKVVENKKFACSTPGLINTNTGYCFGDQVAIDLTGGPADCGYSAEDPLWLDADPSDLTSGHGTHVAGIAAGLGEASDGFFGGVAPGASLYGLGVGAGPSIYAGLSALDWVACNADEVSPEIEVVNNSWGTLNSCGTDSPGDNAAITKLVGTLADKGIMVVWAAGNAGGDGSQACTSPQSRTPVAGSLGVANYDDESSGTLAGSMSGTSSRGDASDNTTWPDVTAPGSSVTAPNARAGSTATTPADVDRRDPVDYAAISGTSMAAPHAAGVVALMHEVNPDLDPAQVEAILETTARGFGAPGYAAGDGLIDARAAVQEAADRADDVTLEDGTSEEDDVTGDADDVLYWRTKPAGLWNLDATLQGWTATEPTQTDPSVARDVTVLTGANPFVIGSAELRKVDLDGEDVHLRFWSENLGSNIDFSGWKVTLRIGDYQQTKQPQVTDDGQPPKRFDATFENVTASGTSFQIVWDSAYFDTNSGNVLLYDSLSTPTSIAFGDATPAQGEDLSPPDDAPQYCLKERPRACFPSIQGAVDGAGEGETILVPPGTHEESVTVDKRVTVAAPAGADLTTVQTPDASEPTFRVTAAGAALQGLEVAGSEVAQVRAEAPDVQLERINTTSPFPGAGIATAGEGGADVLGVTFTDGVPAIRHGGTGELAMERSLVDTSFTGLFVKDGSGPLAVEDNQFNTFAESVQDQSGDVDLAEIFRDNSFNTAILVFDDQGAVDNGKIFSSINSAVDAASDGGTVVVREGTYEGASTNTDGPITLSQDDLTLCSTAQHPGCSTAASATITSNDDFPLATQLLVTGDRVDVKGFTIENPGFDEVDGEDQTVEPILVEVRGDNVDLAALELTQPAAELAPGESRARTTGVLVDGLDADLTRVEISEIPASEGPDGTCLNDPCRTTAIRGTAAATDLTVRFSDATGVAGTAVRADAPGLEVHDNDLQVAGGGCTPDGILEQDCRAERSYGVQLLPGATGAEVVRNEITAETASAEGPSLGGQTGIWGVRSDTRVESNVLSGWAGSGVYVTEAGADIVDNSVDVAYTGVRLNPSADEARLERNDIGETAQGVAFSGSGGDAGPEDVTLRENTFSPTTGIAVQVAANTADLAIDAALNDWGVYDAALVEQRVNDEGEGNTVDQVPFLLRDGSPEPGLVRIAGEAPAYTSIQDAVGAAEPGDKVLVPASAQTSTPTAWNEAVEIDTADVTVCGTVRGGPDCASELSAQHQQLSRAEWADAPGLGSGEAVLFDAAGTSDDRSTSVFPDDGATVDDVDAFAFDYYLEEGTCSEVEVFGQVALDESPDDGSFDRDRLVKAQPSLDGCEAGEWFHVDLVEDAIWSFNGESGSYQQIVDEVEAFYDEGGYEVSAVNVAQTDDATVGYVDNQLVADAVLGERQDVACGGGGLAEADEACRQQTARERAVIDANGAAPQTVTLSAPGSLLADVTVQNTDRPSDNTGTVLLTGDDTTVTGTRVIGQAAEGDGTTYGDQIGIEANSADGFTIADNTVERWSNMGIMVTGAGSGTVADNSLSQNTNHAIYTAGGAGESTLEIRGNDVGPHDASAIRLDSGNRDLVVRDNDLSGAKNQAVLVSEDWAPGTVDLRGNHFGTVREELIRETRITDNGDHTVQVVPYLDAEDSQHPPRPEVLCFTEDEDGGTTLDSVATTMTFQDAVDLELPGECVDTDDHPTTHRTIVLEPDIEEYRGATVDTQVTVLTRDENHVRTQTDGVLAGGARVQAQAGAPALHLVDGAQGSSILDVSVQGEPVSADGIVVDGLGEDADVTVEDARVGVREARMSTGLVVEDSANVTVSSSVFLSGQPSIDASGADGLTVEGSSLAAAPLNVPETVPEADTIRVEDSADVTLSDNTLRGATEGDSTGLRLTGVTDATVAENLVLDAARGVQLLASENVAVEDNVVVATPSLDDTYGLRSVDGSGHQLARNLFQGVTAALELDGTPGVLSNQDETRLVDTGVRVANLTDEDAGFPQLEVHNATLAAATVPLELDESTGGLVVDAECNDWGAYQADLIEARIQDDGEDNTVDYQPWTSATADGDRDCLTPPDAAFTAKPDDTTRLETVDFIDETEEGDRPIAEWRWAFGDGTNETIQAPGPGSTDHSYDEVGSFTVVLEVEDSDGMVSKATAEVEIRNLAPELDPVEDTSVHHSETATLDIEASDPEGDNITLDAWESGTDPQVLPPGAYLEDNGDGTGRVIWSADADQYGSYDIAVQADDGQPRNNLANASAEIEIRNLAPTVDVPDSVYGAETRTLEVDVTAEETDPDQLEDLRANLSDLPDDANATFEVDEGDDGVPNEGTLTWTPEIGHQGVYEVNITAEGPGRTTTVPLELEIDEEIPPAELDASAPAGAPEGTEIVAEATATPDGRAPEDPVEWDVEAVAVYEPATPEDDPATISVEGEVQVDGNTANWTGTLPMGADRVNVTFTADDGLGPNTTTTSTEVQLKPDLDAQQPVETRTGIQTARPILGEDLEFRAGAMDEDGTIQTATVRPADDASALDLTDEDGDDVYTAELNGTDLADAYPEAGGYTATYRVVDDDGLETVQVLEISVEEALAPEVDTTFTEIAEEAEGPHGYTADLRGDAADPNGRSLDELTIEWVAVGTPDGTMPVGDASLRTSADLPVGDYTLELRVTDPYGETGVAAIDVAIDDFVTAEAFLVGEDERFEDGTYRYSALGHALEDLRGWVTVENDQLSPVDGATVELTATYHGEEANDQGVMYAEETVTTPANGTVEVAFEQIVAGVADGPSVVSSPGLHEVAVDVTADSRAEAPDTPADETDSVVLDVWVGPEGTGPTTG
jgi:serine protease AprX